MTRPIQFSRNKFHELVLYIAQQSATDRKFGLTKLYKLLYFIDFKVYGILGESITGATYVRMERGPVPKEARRELDNLADSGDIVRFERDYFNYRQKVIALIPGGREPDTMVFSPREKRIIDDVLDELRHMNARDVSALSHLERGWQLAADGEELPYGAVYISDRPLTLGEAAQAADWLAAGDDDAELLEGPV